MAVAVREESKLKRNITFWPLMGIAYGQIIGAGIMTMTGIAIGMTGTGVFLAYILSAFCTMFSSCPAAILGACLPTTGGNYRYITRLQGKKMGFVFLATYFVSRLTIALYALSCATYLGAFITGVSEQVIAICILVIAFGINLLGNKQSAWVTTAITAALLIGMALFLAYGLPRTNIAFVLTPSNIFMHGPGGFLSALALLSFATGGASVVSNMGGEIVDPHKNIPKVIIISTLSVGVLYGLIALVASGVLSLGEVAGQNLALVAREVMPPWAYTFFALAAGGGATAKTLNVTLSWVSKPVLVAAEDGMFPKAFAKVNERGVPVYLLTTFFIIGLVPLVMGIDISLISKMGTAISLLSAILFSYAFMKLPDKYPVQFENSVLKVSRTAVNIFGWGSIVLQTVFSSSLILGLPTPAIIGFAVLFGASILYANSGALNKITIPDDLAVDYQTAAPAPKAEAEAVEAAE